MANWKHGMYSKEALTERRRVRGLLCEVDDLIRELKKKRMGPH